MILHMSLYECTSKYEIHKLDAYVGVEFLTLSLCCLSEVIYTANTFEKSNSHSSYNVLLIVVLSFDYSVMLKLNWL